MKLTFNGKYDCKLTTRALVSIEDELGKNPLNELFNEDMPKLGTLVTIIYYAMKACNKSLEFNRDNVLDIIDEYFEGENNDIMSLSTFIYQLYKASGLVKLPDIPEEATEEEGTEKN